MSLRRGFQTGRGPGARLPGYGSDPLGWESSLPFWECLASCLLSWLTPDPGWPTTVWKWARNVSEMCFWDAMACGQCWMACIHTAGRTVRRRFRWSRSISGPFDQAWSLILAHKKITAGGVIRAVIRVGIQVGAVIRAGPLTCSLPRKWDWGWGSDQEARGAGFDRATAPATHPPRRGPALRGSRPADHAL